MYAQIHPAIDVHRYEGDWYVIGFKPGKLDKNCSDIRERYEWNDDRQYLDVTATYKTTPGGEVKSARQRLYPVKNTNHARWTARIGLFIRVNCVIHKIADDYSYIVTGHPKRKYLYIMGRKPSMDETVYQQLIDFSTSIGYRREEIVKHVQETG